MVWLRYLKWALGFDRCEQKSHRRTRNRVSRRLRWLLYLEVLENRIAPATVSWIDAAGGDWDTATNWRDDQGINRLPGPNDDAVINVAGNVTITHSQDVSDTVNSVAASDPLTVSGGTLSVLGNFSDSSAVTLQGATLADATVASGTTVTATNTTLNGVTFAGNLTVHGVLTVNQGLTLNNATVLLDGDMVFEGTGTQTLGTTGQVIFEGGLAQIRSEDGPLVVSSGISVINNNAGGGILGNPDEPLTLDGTVTASAGQTITVRGYSVTNNGPGSGAASLQANGGTLLVINLQSDPGGISAAANGSVTLDSLAVADSGQSLNWQNNGAISVSNSTLTLTNTTADVKGAHVNSWKNNGTISASNANINLGGTFTLANLGNFSHNGCSINIIETGTLNNAGQTLNLNDPTQPWSLVGGVISGGTVSTLGQGQLTATGDSTLIGVTLVGELSVSAVLENRGVNVSEGSSGTNVVNVQATSAGTDLTLMASGTEVVNMQTGGGAGSITMTGNGTNVVNVKSTAGPTTINLTGSTDTANVNSTAGPATIILTGSGTDTANVQATVGPTTIDLAGSGSGTVNVKSTGGPTNIILTGSGTDTVNVQATVGPTTIDALQGNNTVNVGSLAPATGGVVANISGSLSVTGGTGTTVLNVDDTADPNAATLTVTSTTLTGLGMATGITYESLQAVNVYLGSVSNTLNVQSASSVTPVDVIGDTTLAPSFNLAGGTLKVVGNLTASDTLVLSGGTLSVTGQLSDSATVYLGNGTLANATVTAGTSLLTRPPNFFRTAGTLQDVTLAGTLTYNFGDDVSIAGAGLTLAGGTITINSGGTLNFSGTQTLGGNGTVTFTNGSLNVTGAGGRLTIAPGVTIHGIAGTVNAGSNSLDNRGTINADVAGGSVFFPGFTITGTNWTNDGLIEATNGSSLNLTGSWTNNAGHQILVNNSVLLFNGSWTNQGTFTSQGTAHVYLGGTFGLANLGSYSRDAAGHDVFAINGTLDLAGQTLDASAGPGNWALGNGTIANGTVNVNLVSRPPDFFRTGGTLQDVTVGGTLTIGLDDETIAGAGLTLAGGSITIRDGGTLNFSGTQTLDGNGTVTFTNGSLNVTGAGGKLTIGPGVTIHGIAGTVNAGANSLDNQGTINADVAGGSVFIPGFTVTGTNWTNDGLIEATNGSSLNLSGSWTNNAGGQILVNSSDLLFNGSWTNQGTFSSQGTAHVYLGGTFGLANLGSYSRDAAGRDVFSINGMLDLAGQTLDASAGPGNWALGNGTIANGTVNVNLVSRPPDFFRTGGTLQDVTVGGTLTIGLDDESIAGAGLTLAGGTITINNGGTLNFSGAQTLAGTGTVTFTSGSLNVSGTGGRLTIAPGITLHGTGGTINAGTSTLDNQGTINADVPGGSVLFPTLTVNGTGWTNEGLLEATSGGILDLTGSWTSSGTITPDGGIVSLDGSWTNSNTSTIPVANGGALNLSGTWSNSGPIAVSSSSTLNISGNWSNSVNLSASGSSTINLSGTWFNSGPIDVSAGSTLSSSGNWSNSANLSASGSSTINLSGTWSNSATISVVSSTLNLGGAFKTSQLGAISAPGSVVNLAGTLTNDGTLSLTDATGPMYLAGGTINGGTVTTSGSNVLFATVPGGILNGISLQGTLDESLFYPVTVNVTNGLTLDNGTILMAGSHPGSNVLHFSGDEAVGGAGSIQFVHSADEFPVINSDSGLMIGPNVTIDGITGTIGDSGGTITNNGIIAADGGGTITVQNYTNFANGTLTGGTWRVSNSSILRLSGANIATNSGTIVLDGAGDHIYSDTGTTDALAGLATNAAGGQLTLRNGAGLSLPSLTNAGTLTVDASSTLAVNSLTQTGGAAVVQGTVGAGAASTVNLLGGTFTVTGTINASLTNAAELDLGSAPAAMQITGDYVQTAAGALIMKVGGSAPGSGYDQLNVSGTATFDGTLNVSLTNGFGPSGGEVFNLIPFTGSTGSFATINLPQLGGAPAFVTQTTPTSFNLIGATTAPNLAVTNVSFTPASGADGQDITVNYSVTNQGTVTAMGSWVDSVYLSSDSTLPPDSLLIGRVPHTGDVAGLAQYRGTLTAPLPGVLDGAYRIVVVADSGLQVPDTNRSNSTLAAPDPVFVRAPVLAIGTPVTGTIANGQDAYYRLNVPPGADVKLLADFAAAVEAEFLVSFAAVPKRTTYDLSANLSDQHPQLALPGGQGGPYYVLLHGREEAGSGQSFTLQAVLAGLAVTAFDPTSGVNQGQVTMDVTGTGFTSKTALRLLGAGGQTVAAQSVTFIDANDLTVVLDLTGVAAGKYTVQASDGTETAQAPTVFQVTAQPPPINLDVKVSSPAYTRIGTQFTVFLDVKNIPQGVNLTDEGGADLISFYAIDPNHLLGKSLLFTLSVDKGVFVPQPGSSGIPPIENGETLIQLKVTPTPPGDGIVTTFDLQGGPDNAPLDTSSTVEQMEQPPTVQFDGWDAVWQNFTAAIGKTTDDLQKVFEADRAYFAQLGEPTPDGSQILNFEQEKANDETPLPFLDATVDSAFPEPGLPLTFTRAFSQPIAGRYQLGLLGRGWVSNWDVSAMTADHGFVIIRQGGVVRQFVTLADGSYVALGGDQGTLTRPNGAFRLTEVDGSVTQFLPDGQLNYIRDQHGNQITADYSTPNEIKLAHSNGQQLVLMLDSQSRVIRVVDPAGRVAVYTYDAAGEHLLSAATPRGMTAYTYITGQGVASEHALASITDPSGVRSNFAYDTQGRLVQTSDGNGLDTLTFGYLSPGGYTITDATGATTTVLVDIQGRPARVADPLGNVTSYHYDAQGNLIRVAGPDDTGAAFHYDNQGNLTAEFNSLGNGLALTSDQTGDLQTFQNSLGASTQFSYSSPGTVQTIMYPNGSTHRFGHDAQGQLTETVLARGQTITYTYDSAGRLLHKAYPDGPRTDFTYDNRGNMLTATDGSGTITMSYDSADRLIQISYPNGRSLSYEYDAAGRRTQVKDQDGFTVNYTYNSIGQLTDVTDTGGARIVHYTYDAAGRLRREDHGNGTYTTYAYDARGLLLHLVNLAPDNSVNSRFDYTYDDLGRRTSVMTLDGTTTYGYDSNSQLISVVLPGGRTINYQYDAEGNRTAVTDNGVPTDYASNHFDQYTTVGGSTYGYDADGNRTVTSGPGGNTTYTYDFENRLIGVTTPTDGWAYRYNALGQRIATTHNGQTTQYLVDPSDLGNVVGEYDAAGNLVAHYTQGLGLTSRVDGSGAASYYDFDAMGSTAGLSGTGGSYVDTYSYLPFGEVQSSTEAVPNPFQFAGQSGVMHEGNDLDFMRARFYVPSDGRFQNRDPLGLAGSINSYSYAANSPVNLADPSGQATTDPLLLAAWNAGVDVYNALLGIGEATAPQISTLAQEVAAPSNISPLAAEVEAPLAQTQIISGDVLAEGQALIEFARGAEAAELAVLNNSFNILRESAATAEIGGLVGKLGVGEVLVFLPADVHDGSVVDKLVGPAAIKLPPAGFLNPFVPVKLTGKIQGQSRTQQIGGPKDPNFLSGPAGFGPQGFVPVAASLPYVVNFENEPTAHAPAQVVTVSQQLDPNLDLSTFQLGDVGFGDFTVPVPPGRQDYSTLVDARSSLGVYVDVNASLDPLAGGVTWTFTTIDPTTLDEPAGNLLEGFLPPDDATGRGEGWVSYTVQPKAADPTGTVVNAKATVTFDTGLSDQSSLDTAPILNTIDAAPPASNVASLPAVSPASFTVSWSGRDDAGGSGIAAYDIFVSEDDGPFTAWLTGTTQTSATYTGVPGHTYAFYSVATDNVDNVQATPTASQASTLVEVPTTTGVATDHANGSVYGQAVSFTATVGAGPNPLGTPTGAVQFQIDGANFGAVVPLTDGTASVSTSALSAAPHSIVALYASDNADFASSDTSTTPLQQTVTPAPLTVTADDQTKAYGAPLPTLTAQYSGFVNGDTPAALGGTLTLTTTATAASHVAGSPYPITPAGLTSTNYAITFVTGTLTVTPVPVTVTADSKTKAYGAALPTLTVSYSGLVNGDTPAALGGTLTLTTTATGASHVASSPFPITPGGLTSTDYTIAFVNGVLTVTPVPLTITADDQTKAYGAPLPTLSASHKGLVNGDSPASLGTPPVLATVATASSPAGRYAITAGGAVAPDYIIGYVNGTLTIIPAATTTALSAMGPAGFGQPLTFTATVRSDWGSAAGGTVTFLDGGAALATVSVDGGTGVAAFTTVLGPGTHRVTAAYSGDGNFQASTAAAVVVTVAPPLTGDVTAAVQATLTPVSSGAKGKSGKVTETLMVRNRGGQPLQGPLSVVLHSLRSSVKLRGASGFVGSKKKRSPYVVLSLPGGVLEPGDSVSMALQFSGKPNQPTLSVFAGSPPT
jgi:RHS repeat-associated protein